ncbi:MAG: aminotransferase class I/II-fold pyridoxal phosphate-dependent enzyme [Flavobacteriales bacterium]|jgi:8-amino-7-oxononanoate synthase|nr:aminotransferase class I/II-fold pyridoxal phosphate-dependent enzyme [Flavobacteriales bacterium]
MEKKVVNTQKEYQFLTDDATCQRVKRLKSNNIYPFFREVYSAQRDTAKFGDQEVLMFGSNNYLGLNNHPEVKAAAQKAIDKYGTSCTGSPFMNGTLDLHRELETELADFLGKEAVIVFPTGFQVNSGVIPSVAQRGDAILMDELNHASIIDGCQMSLAKRFKYKHNSAEDLDKKLKNITSTGDYKKKLIVMDGIFSMDGDIAKLDEIIPVAKKHDALVMVDCAHALGVIGKNGAGTSSHFGLTDEVDLIGGTFSKSLASVGGYIAGSQQMIDYLSHVARTYMFSASLPPASTASAIAALKIMKRDDSLQQKLWENTYFAMKLFKEKDLDIGAAETPIIPIYIRNSAKTFLVAKALFDKGIYVNPVVAPGVKETDALLRFSLTAAHTQEQIKYAIEEISKIVKPS